MAGLLISGAAAAGSPTGIGIATSAFLRRPRRRTRPRTERRTHPFVPSAGPLPAAVTSYLAGRAGQISMLTVYGGTGAVADSLVSAVAAALG